MKGRIFGFQSLGAVDGPGLRCVIFAQGCPLRCAYCHNPESWEAEGGAESSIEELLQKTERLRPYIIKKGGVTLSGGEPLTQPAFSAALLRALRERGYHTALDTSGALGAERAEETLRHTDLVICDLKFTTEQNYLKYCGGSLSPVLSFLSLTEAMKIPLWIRQVIVPGINDNAADAERLGKLARRFANLEKIELLPFKKLCAAKYEKLGIDFPLKNHQECAAERLAPLQKIVEKEPLP
ncbi:MAG: pyruvate formate-lyase-activating protein [Synergistaceae bacterium]|nr:pyruvate formate-lyase-activating protein [Synergistaceae bacterium]